MARRTSKPAEGGSTSSAGTPPAARTPPDDQGPGGQAGGTAAAQQSRPVLIRPPAAETAALRASLADSAAQTLALRAALEELRHQLDAGSAPKSHTRPARRRVPLLLAAGLAGLLVIVVAVALIVGGNRSARNTTSPASSAAPSGIGASGPATAAPQPQPQPQPLPWPGGAVLVPAGVATGGPGIDAAGSDVAVAQDPDGTHLDVFERVVLPAGTTVLPLLPASSSDLKSSLGTARPAVSDLQVQLDGRLVTPRQAAGDTAAWSVPISARGGPARVVLRYRVTGTFLSEQPAVPGRILILITPLSVDASLRAGLPVTVHYLGAGVNSMTCPQATTFAQSLCGQPAGSWWTATLTGGGGVVMVQATLAAP